MYIFRIYMTWLKPADTSTCQGFRLTSFCDGAQISLPKLKFVHSCHLVCSRRRRQCVYSPEFQSQLCSVAISWSMTKYSYMFCILGGAEYVPLSNLKPCRLSHDYSIWKISPLRFQNVYWKWSLAVTKFTRRISFTVGFHH